MESKRFDALTKQLATGLSRRRLVRGVGGSLAGAALAGAGLRRAGATPGSPGGNSACAAFCATVFGDTKAAGQCTSQAAHGEGLCYQCGPASDGRLTLCGTVCAQCCTSADCPTGLVCDATSHVCRSCANLGECAPVDQLGNRFCVALADGSGQSRCVNELACGCPGTCADCGPGSVCVGTGGGPCANTDLCCPPSPAL